MLLGIWGLSFLLILLAFYVKLKVSRRRMEALVANLPGPPEYPIIGSAHLFFGVTNSEDILTKFTDMSKTIGPLKTFKAWIGTNLFVTMSDTTLLSKVLSGPQALDKALVHFFNGFMNGVFVADGKKWQVLRKMLNQTMGQRMLEEYLSCFNKVAMRFCDKLQNTAGTYIDPLLDVSNALVDISLYTHWGVEGNELEGNESNLKDLTEIMFENSYKRCVNIFLYPDFIFKRHPAYKEAKEIKDRSDSYFIKKINERKHLLKKEKSLTEGDPAKRKNVYLDMVYEWAASKGKCDDPKYINENALDVLIGASDTTSVTICQMFYHMARDPEIQRKAQEEVDSIFEDDPVRPVTKDDLKRMKYLEMVMNEALRHYAPPNASRRLTEDIQTEQGTLPTGAYLFIPIFRVHRDPRIWEKPEEFYPEHFLPEEVAKRPRGSFIPFMSGPRSCPGKNYAYWVVKVIVALVLRQYTLYTDMKDMKLKFAIMVTPKDGFSLKFVPRNTISLPPE